MDPKKVFESYPNPKIIPLGSQKAKQYPRIRSELKIRIEGGVEDKICSAIQTEPKHLFEPDPNPKKTRRTPILVQN